MGCACTRAAPGEKHRNDTNEQPTSVGTNRYERVDNNARPETPQKSNADNAPSSVKNPSNASFSKIMGNFFQNKKNQSSALLYNGSSANLIDSNKQAPNSPLLPNSSQDQSNLIENQSNAVLKRLNTVKKKLPVNTINLLCGDCEIKSGATSKPHGLDPSKCQQFDKFNREIQLYLSLPYMSMQSASRAGDALLAYHFRLFEKHLYENFESTSVVATLPSLYDNLCIYCAQKIKNCDLNVINLNYFNASTGGTVALSEKIFNLTANKYFRRMLSKSILNDLLNQSTLNNKNLISNYLCAPAMFVIFLSEYEMQKETPNDLLCPDQIDMTDFKSKIENLFSSSDLDLFSKWYRLDPKLNKYVLDIDYSSLINNPQANEALNDELDKLFALFANIDNKTSGGEFVVGATPDDASFQLKYLKSVQQEEIELIANNSADASTIIWIHLTNTQSSSLNRSSGGSSGAGPTTLATLNPVRYSHLFDLLKDKVLTHNYKQIKVNSVGDSADQKQLNSHVHQMNEFLLDSVKRTIDAFVTELDKNLMNSIALRIDKNLALEIHQHNEYYKYLKYTAPCDAHISLQQVEMRFEVILNEYLRDNLKHPLLVYNNDGNLNEVNYFDIFTSKWMSKLFESNRQSVSSGSNEQHHAKQIIVYRYCNHTVLSSEVVTLIQSIIHQLSYILELHESFAFENPIKIIDNMAKALETHNRLEGGGDGEQNGGQIIIILNGLDRILRTQYDLNIFLYFISKLYDERMQSAFNLKLILTLSCSSLFTHLNAQHGSSSLTPSKAPKLISHLIKKLESQFHNMKPNVKMNIDYHRTLETASSVANMNLKDRLMSSLFNVGSSGEASAVLNFVVDLLLYLLNETRYGVKQVEIFDLFRNSLSNQNLKNLNRASLAYVLNMAWYTVKYHSIIYPKETNLIELTVDNNQLLFRLDVFTQQQQQNARKPSAIGNKFDDIIYSYYNRSSIKQSSPDIDKQTRLISYFNNRIFHELPKYFYLSDSIDPQEELTFLTEFIFNAKWLINKSFTCSSILYYVHDLVFYRKLFLPEQVELADVYDCDMDDSMAKTLGQNKAKFIRFERIVYKLLYNLNQDHNQLHLYLKNTKLDGILTNVNYLNRTTSHLPKFVPLNLSYFKHRDSVGGPRSPAEVQLQIDTNQKSVFFSKVVFIDADTFVTLSEQPYNRLKVWKIDASKPSLLEPIRTINFNKAPKDLRLINKHTAIVLLERNLHLIDLNRCDHVYDLNSTMNPSFAFFELHDSNHVVLLARNRLTVILMKVPQASKSFTDVAGDESKPASANTTAVSGSKDDMFLFKVGEDRYLKSLLVSKNGKIMVCGDEVQKPFPLLVWNLEHRKLVYDLRQPNHEIITSIQSISSSGKYFVSACQEEGDTKNCLIVYDLSTGQLLRKLKAKFDFVCAELNEESNVIIACLENAQIIVYDLSNGSKKFVINSNRYPINKIKMIDQPYRHRTNYFLTYDTTGIDWTIRLWDMTKGDQLIASVTCPARIISLDLNTAPFYLPVNTAHTAAHLDVDYDQIYLIVSLYGVEDLLAIKLNLLDNINNNNSSSKVTNTSSSLNTTSASDTLSTSGFSNDQSLHGLEKSIKL